MRSFHGPIRHLGNYCRFCQRCESVTPWLIVSPPLGVCHPCFLNMPESEFEWIVYEWERRGLVMVTRYP
jgi:hypothetical protein